MKRSLIRLPKSMFDLRLATKSNNHVSHTSLLVDVLEIVEDEVLWNTKAISKEELTDVVQYCCEIDPFSASQLFLKDCLDFDTDEIVVVVCSYNKHAYVCFRKGIEWWALERILDIGV